MKVAVEPAPNQASGKKIIDLGKASEEDKNNDPLLQKLKQWDADGNGVFSPQEVMAAAKELSRTEEAKKAAETMTRRIAFVAGALGFLLLMSIGANFAGVMYAINVSKEDSVPETSGVMLTKPVNSTGDAPLPHPVSTAGIKLEVIGISGLKEATKEELDNLDAVSFYHDGGFHKLSVSQVHRYDGRVEAWGCPVGVLVVEDTGEVHYSPYGMPGKEYTIDNGTDTVTATMDECWGENSTVDMEEICGEAVNNEPPSNLEVEDPVENDPENAPSPEGGRRLIGVTGEGELVWEEDDEYMAEARRLSGRRRGGSSSSSSSSSRRRGGGSSSSSRRRSGGAPSSRRRSSGGYSSPSHQSVPTDSRRRATAPARRRAPAPATSRRRQADVGRRRQPARTDGSSRRRQPNYYNAPTESRRRSVDGTTVAAGVGGLAVGAVGGALVGSAMSSGPSPPTVVVAGAPSPAYYAGGAGTTGTVINSGSSTVSVASCPSNMHQSCSGASCWCEENVSGMSSFISLFIIGGICFCCCVFFLAAAAGK